MIDFIRPKRVSSGLDMAPLIDVVFQLLIFFMLTSSFSFPVALRLDLPSAREQDQREPEKILVSVDKGGNIFLGQSRVAKEHLKAGISARLAADSKKAVHLQGDAEMPYRLFVQVMDLVRRAGARQIHIVHQRETGA